MKLYRLLIQLGCHLGHTSSRQIDNRLPVLSFNKYSFFNIFETINSLQRASLFVKLLGSYTASLLIHNTQLYKFPTEYQLFYVNMCTDSRLSIVENKWEYGQISNIITQALKIIEQLFFVQVKSISSLLSKNPNFLDILYRVIFFSHYKKIEGVNWINHFGKIAKYWRLIHSYKFFKNFKQIPDCLLLVNPSNVVAPLREMNLYNVPIVSTVDSNQTIKGVTYPIYANDDSIILNFFFLKILVKSYQKGVQESYKNQWLG
jgi:ribosomal protein S2